MRYKHLGKRRLAPKKSLDFGLVHPHGDAIGHCACCRQTLWLADQASFTHEFINTQDSDHGFLALFGYDGDFNLAFFNVENCIGVFALRKDDFPLAML
jgi:hypothetical protein